ncbi:MAG: hypothetical protein P4M11_07835 [Candidatus Pacebacteria bacterium]|nr:hypothetical protein [Candidatus Paceibacterota bacterium]
MTAQKLTSPHGLKLEPVETDPYSPVIVQELLQGGTEWTQIHDIVKLTLKAVLDVLKAHSEAIRELDRAMPTKASKAELAAGLGQKASVSDVSKTVAEVAANIESRATVDEVQQLLESKISKTDFQYALSNRVSVDELRTALEQKVNVSDLGGDLRSVQAKVETMQTELQQKLQTIPSARELEETRRLLDQKANAKDVSEALQTKANKDSVAAALNRKANREEVAAALGKKCETEDLQKLVAAVESKIDASEVESIQKQFVSKMGELEEVERKLEMKAGSKELEAVIKEAVELQRLEQEKKMIELEKDVNAIRKTLSDELANMNETIGRKADVEVAEKLRTMVEGRVDGSALGGHLTELRRTMNADIESVRIQLEKKVDSISREVGSKVDSTQLELKRVKEHVGTISDERRREAEESSKVLKSIENTTRVERQGEQREMQKELVALRKEIEFLGQKKCERKELLEVKNSLASTFEQKVDLDEVQKAISEVKTDTAKRLVELSEEYAHKMQSLEEATYSRLERKANAADVNSVLDRKAERATLLSALEQKAGAAELESIKGKLAAISGELSRKADGKELDTHTVFVRENLEAVQKELSLKANIKDVCALVDVKANVDDVNRSLDAVNKELGRKSNGEDLTTALSSQALINEALCAENCSGRWLWKSGAVKSGYAVPWEAQSVNTCPDNFLWEKDKISVLTVAPGLYEVSLGFFSGKKPAVQLLVNGEPVLTPVNSARFFPGEYNPESSYVIHHSTGKIKNVGKQATGNITGMRHNNNKR